MSMITGCPACGTLFRVVPDQLKISEGWVRCGHCGEVFDATAHLHEDPVPHEAGPPAEDRPPAPVHAQAVEDGHATREDLPAGEPAAARGAPPPIPEASHAEAPAVAAPSASAAHADEPAEVEGSHRAAAPVLLRADEALDEDSYLPMEALRREAGPDDDDADAADSRLPADLPVDDDVSFLREARRKAFWRRPLVRALLLLAALGLLALLAVQVGVHDRDRLAAVHPSLRPWLERVCEPLGCRVGAPRRIDAIAIDSSNFTKLRPDAYRLSFTLKNQAGQPVAVPALELTLTDTADQPVVRRVLTPRELGAPAETIAPGGEWSAGAALAVEPAAATRIAGYRLLAFYP